MVRAFASGTGGIGLDPGPRDTKNVKNGTKKRTYSIHGMTNYIIPQRILADAQNTHFPSGKVKKSHLFFSVNF